MSAKLRFFDANVALGRPMRKVEGAPATAAELLRTMDAAGLDKALVWHTAQYQAFPGEGNRLASEAVAGQNRLAACWTLLPPQTDEVVTTRFFPAFFAGGARALRTFPGFHNYLLRRAVFDAFLDETAERRVPLLLALDKGVGWRDIYDLMGEYPDLTCVVCDVGIWGQDRQIWPLLERYPRVYVETSLVSLEAGGLEAGVKRFGAERFLFGSGFPARYIEAPMLDLLHAELTDEAKATIASGNLERLLSEVQQ